MPVITYDPKLDNESSKVVEILLAAKAIEGKARKRTFARASTLLRLIQENPTAKTIRVYAADGFVPNSYKGDAKITRATATQKEDGTWAIVVERSTAVRSYGQGSLTTINNRSI